MKSMIVVLGACLIVMPGCLTLPSGKTAVSAAQFDPPPSQPQPKDTHDIPNWRELDMTELKPSFPLGDYTFEALVKFDDTLPQGLTLGIADGKTELTSVPFKFIYYAGSESTNAAASLVTNGQCHQKELQRGQIVLLQVRRTGGELFPNIVLLDDSAGVEAQVIGTFPAVSTECVEAKSKDPIPRLFIIGHGEVHIRIWKTEQETKRPKVSYASL